MKISIVITVLNEEHTIKGLLDALVSGSQKPYEIILVDGGSTDDTVKRAKKYRNIHIFVKKGNIAKGRNYGIEKSGGEIIAVTDAGCIPSNDWLEKLTAPFKENKKVDVVAGFYDMKYGSAFEEAVSSFIGITARRFNPETFMPSARSVAFKKSVWKSVGGYPEHLERTGEDTLFNFNLVKSGAVFTSRKDARVLWIINIKTPQSAFWKIFNYAKGDAQANILWHPKQALSTHVIKIFSIYGRYLFFATTLLVGSTRYFFSSPPGLLFYAYLFYLLWAVYKHRRNVSQKALLFVPIVQIISDFAVMTGFLAGARARFKKRSVY